MPDYNLKAYLHTQAQETCRAFIIYAPPMSGKTALARRMEDVLGAYRLDVQAYFLEHPELAARIDTFSPQDLEKLLLRLQVSQSVVVVDHLDFLLNTWTPQKKKTFLAMLDLHLKSPDITSKTFVFLLQEDSNLTTQRLVNSRREPRILPLSAFQAL